MSAPRKSTHGPRKGTARTTTTRKATRRRTTRTTRRRTTPRRTQPKVATTIGAALGTLVVTLLLDASWPVRIGLVLLALLLVGGYLYLQGRRHDRAQPPGDSASLVEPAPPASPSPTSPTPSTPHPEDTP